MKISESSKKQSTRQPVMLGTLPAGSQFIYNSVTWEVLSHNPTVQRAIFEGTARCKRVGTPVILNIHRSNYVVPA